MQDEETTIRKMDSAEITRVILEGNMKHNSPKRNANLCGTHIENAFGLFPVIAGFVFCSVLSEN